MPRIKTVDDLYRYVQLVHRRKPREKTYIRAVPVTAVFPTKAQVDVRRRFGEIVRMAQGRKGLIIDPHTGEILPIAAYLVRKHLTGYRSPYSKRRLPKWVERLMPWLLSLKLAKMVKAEAIGHQR